MKRVTWVFVFSDVIMAVDGAIFVELKSSSPELIFKYLPMMDSLTISHSILTSSHYRTRCQWERNQSLNVCVSQNSRSVWVMSHGQLCCSSTHTPYPNKTPPSLQPPLSSWSAAVFLLLRSHCFSAATALFINELNSFINESHCLKKEACCTFMNGSFL